MVYMKSSKHGQFCRAYHSRPKKPVVRGATDAEGLFGATLINHGSVSGYSLTTVEEAVGSL